jgi:hypothetical protein
MKDLTIQSLIVHGICPSCKELTPLVFILDNIYKCASCGEELEQHVNGVIKYLPISNKKVVKQVFGKNK